MSGQLGRADRDKISYTEKKTKSTKPATLKHFRGMTISISNTFPALYGDAAEAAGTHIVLCSFISQHMSHAWWQRHRPLISVETFPSFLFKTINHHYLYTSTNHTNVSRIVTSLSTILFESNKKHTHKCCKCDAPNSINPLLQGTVMHK